MEEKILKELENINIQLKEMNQRFDGVDQRFDGIDQRFEKIDQRFEKIDQRFEKIDQRFEKIDKRFEEIDQRFDKKLNETIAAISKDVGKQIEELCIKIEKRDNREHSKILNELEEHKRRTKKGIETFEKILAC